MKAIPLCQYFEYKEEKTVEDHQNTYAAYEDWNNLDQNSELKHKWFKDPLHQLDVKKPLFPLAFYTTNILDGQLNTHITNPLQGSHAHWLHSEISGHHRPEPNQAELDSIVRWAENLLLGQNANQVPSSLFSDLLSNIDITSYHQRSNGKEMDKET